MNKKKIGLIIVIILVLGIGLFLALKCCNKTEKVNDVKITYSDKVIKFNNFSKDFKEEKTIKVVNTGKENHTYSLEWEAVKNTLAKQNTFTYEIKCTGDRCAELGTSQVPVASAKVYQQVLIEAGKTQEYKIIFTYTGTDKGKFSGKLKVYPEIIDKKKIEEQEKKEREKMEKEMKEQREQEQKQEAKKSNTKESKTKA